MKTILDIGCNNLDGFNLLKTYEVVEDIDVKIFVEANPECWPDLEKHIKCIKNSFLIKKAIDVEIKKTKLITRFDKNKDIGATIMGERFLANSLARWNIKVDKYNEYNVDTTTIIDIINDFKIDSRECILKFDAEGAEYGVLNQILNHNIVFKKIYCEFHIHSQEDEIQKQKLIKNFENNNQKIIEWH